MVPFLNRPSPEIPAQFQKAPRLCLLSVVSDDGMHDSVQHRLSVQKGYFGVPITQDPLKKINDLAPYTCSVGTEIHKTHLSQVLSQNRPISSAPVQNRKLRKHCGELSPFLAGSPITVVQPNGLLH